MSPKNTHTDPAGFKPGDGTAKSLRFEDMGLRVGASLSMRSANANADATRHRVEFIGAVRGKSLLVTLPLVNGKGLWLPQGQQYVFHTVEGMHAYAFTGDVLRARNSPLPYVHFSYPTRIDARQVRSAYRVKLRLPVVVTSPAGQRDALLLDLSMSGALLEMADAGWQDGEAVSLIVPVELQEASSQVTLAAVVRNRIEPFAGGATRYGVEFAGLPQNDALLLHYYIDHAIAVGA